LFRREEDGLWWYFLKADNTGVADGWIPYYRLAGKVTHVGGKPRATTSARRADYLTLWRSRLGYALYRFRSLTELVYLRFVAGLSA
jgi:hypothetical protein